MADAISLNPSINNAQNIDLGTVSAQSTTASVQNNKSQNSIFANSSLNAATNDYSNDLMMANLNFSSISAGQTPQTNQTTSQDQSAQIPQQAAQTQQNITTPQFTSNGQTSDTLTGCLADKNANKKSNIGKLLGGIAGFLAPLAGKVIGLCKGQSVKALFDLKQLAITCPLIGAAGFGVGVLVDSYLDTQKAKQAQQPTPSQAQQLVA